MIKYVIYRIETTEAHFSIDGKTHHHKLYLHPVPDHLKDLGFSSCWNKGRRDAIKYKTKAAAARIAKKHQAKIEPIETKEGVNYV